MNRIVLPPKELLRACSELRGVADSLKISLALVGGFALQQYGSDRLTADLDVLASRPIRTLPQLGPLTFGGQRSEIYGVPLDLIVREDDFKELYLAALHAARTVSGLALKLVPPEYLLAMKLVAGRTRDGQDIEWLLSQKKVDLPAARALIKRYLGAYAAKDFDSVVSEVEWKASRGLL